MKIQLKLVYKLLLISFLFNNLYANNKTLESQPEIIFNYDKLKKYQDKVFLQIEFNRAILFLNKKEYKKAIKILETTTKLLEVPSYLNMGIAYYKLNLIDKSIIFLNKVYENKYAKKNQAYSYMSSAFYLYKISKDEKYLNSIVNTSKRYKKLSEHSKRMLADTFIILKEYKKALKVLDSMEFALDLKKGMLYLKLKLYDKAELHLKKAKENTSNTDTLHRILWMLVYLDLKTNNLENLRENLDLVKEKKSSFKSNIQMPLEIYFNKNKYSSFQYLDFVTKLKKRKYDFIYYFTPFIFSDKYEISYDSIKGFIFNSKDSLSSIDEMVKYNKNFIDIVKNDPIIRVNKLKALIKKDTKSYVYYNLALSYAQISDFHNAYKYFEKATRLNPGNKLYSMMMLITAQKLNIKVKDAEYLKANVISKNGLFKYFGYSLYKLFINENYNFDEKPGTYKNTIFYKSMDYITKLQNKKDISKHPLLSEYQKDPLIFLLRLVQRGKEEDDFEYFSRLQDSIPLVLNNNFLEGPIIITQVYIDILKAIGLFHKADIYIGGKSTPSYLRMKAYQQLHQNKADEAIEILEYLRKEYNLEDRYNMFLMVASLLEAGRYNDASLQISLIKALLNDKDADFLTGIQLIQELKISSAKRYITSTYHDTIIDFKLLNFDEYLESL